MGRDDTAKIEFANALRGVASVLVAVTHISVTFWTAQKVLQSFTGLPELPVELPAISAFLLKWAPVSPATFGVGLFFTISGFVIPYSLLAYTNKGFLVGRFFRLYPTYWACLTYVILFILAASLFDGVIPFKLRDVIAHYIPPFRLILNTQPIDGVVWSLEVEVMFYLLCCALASPIRKASWLILIGPLGAFAVWFGIFLVTGPFAPNGSWHLWQFKSWGAHLSFLPFMFCGVALNFRQRELFTRLQASVVIAICLALYLSSWYFAANIMIDPQAYVVALGVFVVCMWGQRWFRQGRVFRYLANISYPLYIVHSVPGYVIMHALVVHGVNPTVAIGAALLMAFTSATLIHRYVEKPTHRLGQRLARAASASGRDPAERGANAPQPVASA